MTTVSSGSALAIGRGLAVRQAEEDHVVPGERLDGGLLQDPVGQRHQVRLQRAERLAGVGAGGDRADLDVGVRRAAAAAPRRRRTRWLRRPRLCVSSCA